MEKTKRIEDISDGAIVSDTLIGLYCNRFSCNYKDFYGILLAEQPAVQYNFTVLCLEWFGKLADVCYYDGRNEDSVMLARSVKELCGNEFPRKHLAVKGVAKDIEVCYTNGADIAKMTVGYLKLSCGDYTGFIKKALYEHKTLQQNFTRLCVNWFGALCKANPNSKAAHVALASKVIKLDIRLRYI